MSSDTDHRDEVSDVNKTNEVPEKKKTKVDYKMETNEGDPKTEGAEGVSTVKRTEGVHKTDETEGARKMEETERAHKTDTTVVVPKMERGGAESKPEGDEDVFKTEVVEEINKRSLGTIILKYCGNEGNVENESQTSLRKLLQASSNYLQKENEKVWKNAEINIYDNDDQALTVKSGKGENSFIVQYKGKSEDIEIVNEQRKKQCCIS